MSGPSPTISHATGLRRASRPHARSSTSKPFFGTNRPTPAGTPICKADLGEAYAYKFPLFCGVPAAPTALAATAATHTAVQLGWTDNSNNETGFHIYRNGSLVGTVGSNATQFTDNPPYGGPYSYVVKAYNSAGESGGASVNEAGCIY